MVSQWGQVFGDDVLAAAILDSLRHHSRTVLINGDSYRLKQKRKAGLLPARDHQPSDPGGVSLLAQRGQEFVSLDTEFVRRLGRSLRDGAQHLAAG